MTPEPEKASQFIDKVREIVRVLRYGPRELALATLGLLLFAAGPGLKKLEWLTLPVWVFISLSVIGLLLLALAIRKVWKKVVAPLPVGKPKPPAIKGPASFGPQDADLFARLERNDELGRLRGWILDDQKPLIALMGESGVGKTSLLRAGLPRALEEDGIKVIYWEALPTDPEMGLLHAVKSSWDDKEKEPSLATLASAVRSGKCVVVLDQMEQLTPERHARIFELLKDAAIANPPYQGKWLVAFRREYAATWRDFELDLPEHARGRIESLSLRRFTSLEAQKVGAVLVEEGGLEIDQKLVRELIDEITVEGRVSPVDIGISLLVLSEAAEKGGSFSLDDFRSGGGQVGLLTRYLERLLGDFPEGERSELLKALLALIDVDKDQRLGEGRDVTALAQAARPASPVRFAGSLRFLASGKARILEELANDAGPKYRLIHERLIPALRSLTGALLAEVDQARLLLERTFREWVRDHRRKYLLSGRELKHILEHQGQFAWGEDAQGKRDFVRLSRRRRAFSRSVLGAGLVAFAGLALAGTNYLEGQRARASLKSWNLPADLYDRLDQLEELSLTSPVNQFAWIADADNLKRLSLHETRSYNLKGLPARLQSLRISDSWIRSLEGLPVGLTSLSLSDNVALWTLEDLPEGLRSLRLRDSAGASFDGATGVFTPLPFASQDLENLQSLEFFGAGLTDLKGLPGNLKSLTLSRCHLYSLEGLPAGLKVLSLADSWLLDPKGRTYDFQPFDIASLPRGLETLDLSGIRFFGIGKPSTGGTVMSLEGLPAGLTRLGLRGVEIKSLAGLPTDLQSLEVSGTRFESLKGIPRNLKSLIIRDNESIDFKDLPPGLQALEVSGTLLTSLEGLPTGLKSLALHYTEIASLGGLPSGLQSLDVSGSRLTYLEGLPVGLKSLILRGTEFRSFKDLPEGLQDLDVSGARFSSLHGLPAGLKKLNLRGARIGREINGEASDSEDQSGSRVQTFILDASMSVDNLKELPAGLESLNLGEVYLNGRGKMALAVTDITSLDAFPNGLKRLDLSQTRVARLQGAPQNLKALVLRVGQVETLAGLPKSVTALHFE